MASCSTCGIIAYVTYALTFAMADCLFLSILIVTTTEVQQAVLSELAVGYSKNKK